ncbi:MAG: signal peptidase II [Parcubacteria group bacterium]|jgi:signal peptidase II
MKLCSFIIFVVLVAIDQLSKYLIRQNGGFYICNFNISWSIPVSNYMFVGLWIILMLILFFLFLESAQIFSFQFSVFNKIPNLQSQTSNFSLVFILSGAISNIIDRIRYGCVIDFINLNFWPVFNLADIFIVLGIIFLLVKWKKI